MNTKKIEFAVPEGFSVPEGLMAGDTFDSVCTFRLKDNGDICLVMLGDTQMPGYSDTKSDSRPGYSDKAKQMASYSGDEDEDE